MRGLETEFPRGWAASPALRPLVRGVILGAALFIAAAAFFWGGNAVFPPPVYSRDQGRIMWLSGAGPLFESAGPASSDGGARMAVAAEYRVSTREPTFALRKLPGVYRIVCIGGSTTAGWPFQSASYPRFLSAVLSDVLPGRPVEVINAGFEASDSASDVRLVEQVAGFEPDLLLVYEGRNDRWNLPLHLGWRGVVLRLHCKLLRSSRAYAALNAFSERLAGVQDFDDAARRWTGTAQRLTELQVRANLEENLGRMTDAARRRGIGIAFLTQAASPEEERSNPEIFKINSWIRTFAAGRGAPVVDVEREFRSRWARADRLLIPPPTVHPDLRGYLLIARAVARTLAENGLIAPRGEWRMGRARADGRYIKRLGMKDRELREVYSSLGRFFAERGDPAVARRYLDRANAAALGSHVP